MVCSSGEKRLYDESASSKCGYEVDVCSNAWDWKGACQARVHDVGKFADGHLRIPSQYSQALLQVPFQLHLGMEAGKGV